MPMPGRKHVLFGTLHIAVNQHFVKAGLNNRLDKPAVITAHCLNAAISFRSYQRTVRNVPQCL